MSLISELSYVNYPHGHLSQRDPEETYRSPLITARGNFEHSTAPGRKQLVQLLKLQRHNSLYPRGNQNSHCVKMVWTLDLEQSMVRIKSTSFLLRNQLKCVWAVHTEIIL